MLTRSSIKSRNASLPAGWVALAILAAALALAWALSKVLPLALIDLGHYLQAARLIWQRASPYGAVEFFAPPWMALLLAPLLPLPIELASAIWILGALASVCAAALVALSWPGANLPPWARMAAVVLAALAPASLFVYITGQVSALVTLAAVLAGAELLRPRPRAAVIALALVITTLKPNIVWLPAAFIVAELVRRRQWRVLLACAAAVGLLALFAFALLPGWPAALLTAWQGGAYRGGAGLVAAGYIGLADLGVPALVFLPLLTYACWRWWREGVSAPALALALAVCLVITPYSRAYDGVALIFPALACLSLARGRRRWLALVPVVLAWAAPALALAVLAPIFCALAVLIAFPAARAALREIAT